jgi:hypothetical protein
MKFGMYYLISKIAISIAIIISLSGCCKEQQHKDCSLLPDPGPCKALFKKYYYDQNEKKCKQFNWGGCDGVVPFETLEDCQKKCSCGN